MAKQNDSSAYNFALFEERGNAAPQQPQQPEKRKPQVVAMPGDRIQQVNRKRRRLKSRKTFIGVVGVLAVAGISSSLVFGQVRLAELTQQIEAANVELTEAQSLYTQYQMKTDSQYSLTAVEAYAANLGMTKAEQSQMSYISLSNEDKGEVVQKDQTNWLGRVWNYIVQLLS